MEETPHDVGLHDAMEETPHDVGLHDEDEKKSVLKKVKDKAKDKAKKIKDTLKLHGHGHNHDEEAHVPDDHDLDEEEHDEVDDPEIHLAHDANKSSEVGHEKGSPATEGTDPMNPKLKVAVERTSGIKEVPRAPTNTPASITPGIVQQTKGMDRLGGSVPEQEFSGGKPELNLEGLTSLEEDPHAPDDRPGDYKTSSYQSKVADPTGAGGEAAGISQVLRSLDKMSVSGDREQGSKENLSTGSHDQISPEPIKQDNTQEPETRTGQETSRTATLPVEYGKRVATTVTEKLAPVYEKVAEAGHMVTEKLSPVYQKVSEAGSTVMSKVHGNEKEAGGGIEGQEKGVSVKDYIAEKFRPREEDKALSEVISDALHKRKEKFDEREKPIGKVTESEEVRRQPGSHSDASYEEGKVPSSAYFPEKGVVGKVKGAVGSWLGKGQEESRPSQQSLGSSTGPEELSTSATAETGERRLQEVGN